MFFVLQANMNTERFCSTAEGGNGKDATSVIAIQNLTHCVYTINFLSTF